MADTPFDRALEKTLDHLGLYQWGFTEKDIRAIYDRHVETERMALPFPEEPPHWNSPVAAANAAWQSDALDAWDRHTSPTAEQRFDNVVFNWVNIFLEDPSAQIPFQTVYTFQKGYETMMQHEHPGERPPGSP